MNKIESNISNLLNNTVVYMIGMSLSKVLNFLILPYISKMINSESFGIYDIVQTIAGLIVPIVTLQIIEAAFRFMFETSEEEKKKVISNVWYFVIGAIVVFLAIGYLLNEIFLDLEYFDLLCIYTISTIFMNLYQRIARSYDLRKEYALSGIIQTIVVLLVQLFFLKFTNFKEDGLVYAYLVSVVVSCVYIETRTKALEKINFRLIDLKCIWNMIKFSAPLVPNSISWWGVSSVGRIIIIMNLGYMANGIYSMSNKFASLITMVTSTFLLAFQEFLISEKNEDEDSTLVEIFNHYLHLLAIGTGALLLLQQMYFEWFIDEQYMESLNYIPLVMLSMFFSSIASFYGTGYFAYKRTGDSLKTTIISAVVNIVLSVVLINILQLWGIALACVGAYLTLCVLRHNTMKEYFKVELKILYIVSAIIVLVGTTIIFYMDNVIYSILALILIAIYTFYFYRDVIKSVLYRKYKK